MTVLSDLAILTAGITRITVDALERMKPELSTRPVHDHVLRVAQHIFRGSPKLERTCVPFPNRAPSQILFWPYVFSYGRRARLHQYLHLGFNRIAFGRMFSPMCLSYVSGPPQAVQLSFIPSWIEIVYIKTDSDAFWDYQAVPTPDVQPVCAIFCTTPTLLRRITLIISSKAPDRVEEACSGLTLSYPSIIFVLFPKETPPHRSKSRVYMPSRNRLCAGPRLKNTHEALSLPESNWPSKRSGREHYLAFFPRGVFPGALRCLAIFAVAFNQKRVEASPASYL
ncbi:hypothetical protein A0H81_13486 [Grifola frondosa]|uniref:Uncharacterized protein n=1 Tax=Grifola frondosa TaxID=5627 RepID=A0A1C7LPD0_GRIFR|nr:hypothetical protein A0H81_13486 [Grifola frondosa]